MSSSFQPFNSLSVDSNQVNFIIPAFTREYIKLDSVKYYGTARILEIDGDNLKTPEDAVDISVVTSLPTSIWSRVSVRFNDLDLDQNCQQSYAYKVKVSLP